MSGDIDNRIKALSDLLVAHRIVEDDSLAQSILVARDEAVPFGRVRLAIAPFQQGDHPYETVDLRARFAERVPGAT